jgi:hypothetical protein
LSKAKCPTAKVCVLEFPAVAGSGVFIERVSCVISIKTGGILAFTVLSISGQSGFNAFGTSKTTGFEGDADFYTANAQTDLFVDVGQSPTITISSAQKAIEEDSCTISGFHI